MGRIAFHGITEEEDLIRYLRQVLSRPTSTMCLTHYTKFSSLQAIIDSESLLLKKPTGMNDKTEYESISKNGLSDRLFYSCFSLVSESAEMWNMYTAVNDGCQIKICFNLAREMLKYNLYLGDTTERLEKESIEDFGFSSVAYYSKSKITDEDYLKCRTAVNTCYDKGYQTSGVAGMIKSEFWRYENEARLILRTNKDFKQYDYLKLQLDEEFKKHCRVVISPFTTHKKEEAIKEYCRGKGIACFESAYSGTLNLDRKFKGATDAERWMADTFDNRFGRSVRLDTVIARVTVRLIEKWTSEGESIAEHEKELTTVLSDLLYELDQKEVKKFADEVIKYAKDGNMN